MGNRTTRLLAQIAIIDQLERRAACGGIVAPAEHKRQAEIWQGFLNAYDGDREAALGALVEVAADQLLERRRSG